MDRVQKQVGKYLSDTIINMHATDEEIRNHFKKTDFRSRIYGVSLEKQVGLPQFDGIDEEEEEKQVDDNIPARAILIKIFASDLFGFVTDDREQLARMFSRTFAISNGTRVEHILQVSCDFWGVDTEKYSIFYEGSKGIEEVNEGQKNWKISTLMTNSMSG